MLSKRALLILLLCNLSMSMFAITTEDPEVRLFNLIYAIGIADVETVYEEATPDIVNLDNEGIYTPLGQALHLLAQEENNGNNRNEDKVRRYKEIIEILRSRGAHVILNRWDEWISSGRKLL